MIHIQSADYFQLLVEKLRRGRCRVRPALVPPLCAWLLLQARRYERHLNRFATIDGSRRDKQIEQTVQYIHHACQVIQHLVDDLTNGFDGFEWVEACNAIDEQLGLISTLDIPSNLETAGKIVIPAQE